MFENFGPASILGSLFTLIATFLGFLGALHISNRAERNQKKKDIEKQRGIYKKRLIHLTNLISDSLDIVDKQLSCYEKLAEEIKNAPTETHMLQMTANKNLDRLQRMDTEGIFSAYDEIISDSETKLKDYKNIYNAIDFIYLRLKHAIESNERRIGFCHRDQMYIKEKIDGLSGEFIKIINSIESCDNGFKDRDDYKFLATWYIKLVAKPATLGEIEQEMMLPFFSILKEKHGKMPYFPILYDFTSQALFRFAHLKRNANSFVADISNMRNEMQKTVDKLKEINEKIKYAITIYQVHGG